MSKTAFWELMAAIYIFMAIFTFGHYLNNKSIGPSFTDPLSAPFCAVFWPFYWSWELQREFSEA